MHQLAQTVIEAVGPLLPFLLDQGRQVGEAFAAAVDRAGGQAIWEAAKKLWSKCLGYFEGDAVVQAALKMVGAAPDNETFQAALRTAMARHFEAHPDHATAIEALLKQPGFTQLVRATGRASIGEVEQRGVAERGSQTVEAHDDARIGTVKQGFFEPD
ncbi:MAG: hypothetical protein R6X02_16625 [Enhygromyxa sp.]